MLIFFKYFSWNSTHLFQRVFHWLDHLKLIFWYCEKLPCYISFSVLHILKSYFWNNNTKSRKARSAMCKNKRELSLLFETDVNIEPAVFWTKIIKQWSLVTVKFYLDCCYAFQINHILQLPILFLALQIKSDAGGWESIFIEAGISVALLSFIHRHLQMKSLWETTCPCWTVQYSRNWVIRLDEFFAILIKSLSKKPQSYFCYELCGAFNMFPGFFCTGI